MSLDVETPPPPSLSDEVQPDEYEDADVGGEDYHREDLAAFLAEGAWERAFEEWAARTEMGETEFAIARDLDLFERYDFFWDAFAQRVGYHAPGIPENWKERNLHPALDSWAVVSTINAELTEFGQVVSDLLGEEYVDWDEAYEAPEDLPDF